MERSKLSFRLAELFVDLADKSKPDDENAELFVDLADKSKPERDDDHPVLNDKNEENDVMIVVHLSNCNQFFGYTNYIHTF
jgi:hypothetical protein